MRVRALLFAIVFLVISRGGFHPARAEAPPLGPSDLDAAIAALPVAIIEDPVERMERRLAVLQASKSACPERIALGQAIELIRIVRSNRITTSAVGRGAFNGQPPPALTAGPRT